MAYTPLRISTVKPLRELTFDLYIFFKNTYVLYSNRGSQIEEEKYGKLRKQKIAKFYISEEDESNYQQFLDKLLQETMNSTDATVDEKVNLVQGACDTAVERMHKDPNSEISYQMTENAGKSLRQCIVDNPDALKKIFGKKADESDLIIKHSLNVSALSTKLGEKMNLSESELDNIATAGLLHDIGIMSLDEEIQALFKKPKKDFTPDERVRYGHHVKDAITALKEKSYVNQKIISLVVNHEEVCSGDGPNKLTKLTTSESIISLVNIYDKMMITLNMSPAEAMKEIVIDQLGNFELELINKFKTVLKAEGLLD